jgi:hypothetical protein
MVDVVDVIDAFDAKRKREPKITFDVEPWWIGEGFPSGQRAEMDHRDARHRRRSLALDTK